MSSKAFALVIVVLVLGGCSGSPEGPTVATLQSPAATASRSVDQRPVFPVDATEDDKLAMAKPWVDCLVENAGPQYRDSAAELIMKGGIMTDDAKGKAALQTCLPQQPETYGEHQRRTDLTAFQDNQREWYRCAKAAGYRLTAPDPDTGEFGLTEIGPDGDFGSPKILECERQAFAE
ncbi:MAG: hypothetical protein ABW046_10670 [Actinoplanes sp.]